MLIQNSKLEWTQIRNEPSVQLNQYMWNETQQIAYIQNNQQWSLISASYGYDKTQVQLFQNPG